MNLKEFKITVSDGKMIDVKLDKAKQQTIGVIHLFHGMADHMDRYDRLVASLNQQGYDVLRHNHRGHGISIADNERGHFDSIERLQKMLMKLLRLFVQIIIIYLILLLVIQWDRLWLVYFPKSTLCHYKGSS